MNRGIDVSKIFSWIFTILVIIVLIGAYKTYKKHYFGDFIKAENEMHISEFLRDNEIKYSKKDSYKIESPNYNDAVFYKEVKVKPNTAYKVTCMVKTENIIAEKENTDAGAMISLLEEIETSKSIVGTNDWQELTFMFNSKNRETVKIAFRLGGNLGKCKGTVWFSDLKLEEGLIEKDNSNWKMACFIFKNIKVDETTNDESDTEKIKLNITMDENDIENIKSNMERFADSCQILSKNKMTVDYDIYEIETPITTLSYSQELQHHVSPQDVEDMISDVIFENDYDHIIAVVRMGNAESGIEVKSGDWIGLRWNGLSWNRFFDSKIFNECK